MALRQRWLLGLGPRQVEKCWRAIIKTYASTEETDISLALLKEFRRRYPADELAKEYQPFAGYTLESRMVDITKVAEPEVPPHLLFTDVDVLHQRLVRKEDWAGVATLKFITKQYEHGLFKRKSYRTHNVGVSREKKQYKEEKKLLDRARKKAMKKMPKPAPDEDMEDQWDDYNSERRQPWNIQRVAE
jgi:hypothetical protein